MELLNLKVKHKKFGTGTIISNEDNKIIVHFPDINSEKKFVYPDAFEKFLQIDEQSAEAEQQDFAKMQEQIKEKQEEKKKREEQEKIKRLEEELLHDFILANNKNIEKKMAKKVKIQVKKYANIAIRKDMSEAVLKDGVEEFLKEGKFSITFQNKKKEINQWAEQAKTTFGIITSVPLGESEVERMISGIFMTEAFQMEGEDGGTVFVNSQYQLPLNIEEMKRIKFWEYYFNPEEPAAIKFPGEEYCYFSDNQAAQILLKLYEVKQAEKEKQLVGQCLDYFCRVKKLDLCKLEKPEGPLA